MNRPRMAPARLDRLMGRRVIVNVRMLCSILTFVNPPLGLTCTAQRNNRICEPLCIKEPALNIDGTACKSSPP
jgi:hypothetical protein